MKQTYHNVTETDNSYDEVGKHVYKEKVVYRFKRVVEVNGKFLDTTVETNDRDDFFSYLVMLEVDKEFLTKVENEVDG